MTEAFIPLSDSRIIVSLFGTCDQHVRKLRDAFQVDITHRDGKIRVSGSSLDVSKATKALERLKSLLDRQGAVGEADVSQVLGHANGDNGELTEKAITVLATGREVRPRTQGQDGYVKAIRKHDLTFAVGPAGTGKTYLAVALAVEALREQRIRKIVLVRPAVEAGESLGYLPGDLQAKINPYLRPLLDALYEMMDYDQIKRYMEKDIIEVVPLAYMRGRTLNEAFIILDEAQNTTVAQMKMFLTRMGTGSKIVVAGDETQVDLPQHTRSGLADAIQRLDGIEGIASIRLTKSDIVRHPMVMRIVHAYEGETSRQLRTKR
jgi:phosphate starvation-inducible PhoH-like protein